MTPRASLRPSDRLDRLVTEKELSAFVAQCLTLHKWLWYHTYDSRRSNPGFVDIVAVRDGEIRFIELKTQVGRVSQAQQHWLSELGRAMGKNVWVHTWRPSDMREITETLK